MRSTHTDKRGLMFVAPVPSPRSAQRPFYYRSRLLLLLLLLTACVTAGCPCRLPLPSRTPAPAWQESKALEGLFFKSGLDGTFVLYDHDAALFYGANHKRSETRFIPASTFKIMSSLIAFETGVVKDAQEVLPYGGQPQSIKAWEHDMNIKEAIKVSNVPLYKGIARRIGLERMHEFVWKANYGNVEIGSTVDTFWLEGPLEISAIEQTLFLDALTRGRLPFSTRSIGLLREIMPSETLPGTRNEIFFKTGWSGKSEPNVIWIVGWVRRDGKEYPFALNFDLRSEADMALRMPLVRNALQRLDF